MISFSIIIPVYNAEKYIENTLRSVINQNEDNFEIVVIDDGSTDNSLNIIKRIAKSDKRIKVFSQKNQGVSCARNLGLDKTNGKYILFLDSDDELPQYTLSNYYKIFQIENPDIIEGNVVTNKRKNKCKSKYKIKKFNRGKAIKYFLNCKTISGYAGGKVYKKSILRNIRFIPSMCYGEDGIFFLTALLRSHKFVYAFFDCYKYTIRLNSLTGRGKDYSCRDLDVFKQSRYVQKNVPKEFQKYTKIFIFELYISEINKFWNSTFETQKSYYRYYNELQLFCNKNVSKVLFASFNLRVKKDAINYLIRNINRTKTKNRDKKL